MTTNDGNATASSKRTVSRIGYAVAVVMNLVLLFVVSNLLAWGWFPFLTDDFERLLPIVSLSFVVGAIANAAFIIYNARWFRSVGQIVENVVSLFVIVFTLKIFPFDFSSYGIDWALITRIVMVLTGIALLIGTIVEVVKLVRSSIPEGYAGSDAGPTL